MDESARKRNSGSAEQGDRSRAETVLDRFFRLAKNLAARSAFDLPLMPAEAGTQESGGIWVRLVPG